MLNFESLRDLMACIATFDRLLAVGGAVTSICVVGFLLENSSKCTRSYSVTSMGGYWRLCVTEAGSASSERGG